MGARATCGLLATGGDRFTVKLIDLEEDGH
jgi:hypothetical protein